MEDTGEKPQPIPGSEDVYAKLATATPDERLGILLELVAEDPENRILLPSRDGVCAELRDINATRSALMRYLGTGDPNDRLVSSLTAHLFAEAGLRGAVMVRAQLQGLYIHLSDLREVKLDGANMEQTWFLKTDLRQARLFMVRLSRAKIEECDLQEACLASADLRETWLAECNLREADLRSADLRGCRLEEVNLEHADLQYCNLQAVDLSRVNMRHARLGGAWLDHTRFRREQLGNALGEEIDARRTGQNALEMAQKYSEAKSAYMLVKQNFDDLGDYDAASWAYKRERRMEKLEAFHRGRNAIRQSQRREAVQNYTKFLGDQLVELVCDYGEGVRRVIACLIILWLGFAALYGAVAGVWGPWQETGIGSIRHITRNPLDLLSFSLGAMVTIEPVGLEARSILMMRALTPLEAVLGIFLTGLLGFVTGNRIRRS